LRETLNAHATYGRRGSETDFPFLDKGGYKGDTLKDINGWEVWRDDGYLWWKPYGQSGAVYEDGGLLPPAPGTLPVVKPPKERYGPPYNMDPIWQEGSTETSEYYAKNCPVRVHGRLHYKGPSNICANASFGSDTTVKGEKEECFPDQGHFRWGWLEKFPDGEYNDPARMGPLMRNRVRPGPLDKLDKEMLADHSARERKAAEFYLKYGYELPPWLRRGPYAVPDLIKKHCPPGANKSKRLRVPDRDALQKEAWKTTVWGLG
jgi:hypothetical protein